VISGKKKNLSFLNICQTDSLAPHPAFCQMETRVCLPVVKRPWCQNWQFTRSTARSRMRGVIYPLTHSLSFCDYLVNTGAALYVQKWEGPSDIRKCDIKSEGNWETKPRRSCFDQGTGIAKNKRLLLFPVCHTSNILSLCQLHFPAIDFYDYWS